MLKLKKFLGLVLLSMMFVPNVKAAECSYSEQAELNRKAGNVKINYEVITEKEEFDDMTVDIEKFKITILNVTEELYVAVSNDRGLAEKVYYSSDAKDGEISFVWEDTSEIANFTVDVYASGQTNCGSKKLTTIHKKTPRYNEYYDREICNDNENFYLCQKYVTFSEINNNTFLDKMESYISGEINEEGKPTPELSFMDKVINFLDDYKWFILGAVIIGGGAGGYIYYRKSKKQRELGL